ncbi:MAG: CopD family protein [Phenylobacterium sp.]|nr:MAG: CopD family protein [Phenylobacterium sp.]
MTSWIVGHYNLVRGLHIISVIAWMAGMMFLPRLFAYHTETAAPGSEFDGHFKVWEAKLLRIIINPAMVLTFIFGLTLIYIDGSQRLGWSFLTTPWMLTKLAGIVFLSGWHGFLARSRRQIAAGERPRSGKFWRMTNELPFLAAIVMVLAITTKFGG